jgi:hypothetical protein
MNNLSVFNENQHHVVESDLSNTDQCNREDILLKKCIYNTIKDDLGQYDAV